MTDNSLIKFDALRRNNGLSVDQRVDVGTEDEHRQQQRHHNGIVHQDNNDKPDQFQLRVRECAHTWDDPVEPLYYKSHLVITFPI